MQWLLVKKILTDNIVNPESIPPKKKRCSAFLSIIPVNDIDSSDE